MSGMHGGGGGGGVNPSNLHLKKELTQIRRAARVLRDPGTTSSWRHSPLSSSARSAGRYPRHLGGSGGNTAPENVNKKVFLHNWRGERSENTVKSGSEESDARDSGRDEGSKSDSIPERYASVIFKCKGAHPSQSIRRNAIKKKSRKNSSKQLANALRQQIGQSKSSKNAFGGMGTDDSASLIEQSDDTGGYCSNSSKLHRYSVGSPLLSRLRSSKFLRNSGKDDSSHTYNSTPALSTSSYNRYVNRNHSTIGSWDDTTASFNDADDEVDDPLDLPGRQGCGIPCYWSKRATPKHRGSSGSWYSPSFSDTLWRKERSILSSSHCGYRRRSGSKNRIPASRIAQGVLPLLTNSGDGQGGSSGCSDDELSTNFGELNLEAVSRLDGRRWSTSCRSREGLELVSLTGEEEEGGGSTPDNVKSLSQKYRPLFFEEIIGQNIVVQSLKNAISRVRIAPLYLFQGPRGTGKSSTARIFAAALNCLASEESKPCGVCRECADFMSGKSNDLKEVDSTSKKGIERVKNILRNLPVGSSTLLSRFKVFVIDECHLLPSKTWLAFLKFLEEPPPRVVFIFISTDLENLPRTVLSRCQKYIFNKIKDSDIVARLRKIAADENLDADSEALDLIALNADGSLRDAETMLDQLSLLGKRVTTSLVNELVGVVSDEKLLELLELAMSSETAETVKRARELMDSGVDPIVVMSQLATLIMDIIAGTYQIIDSSSNGSFIGGRGLTQAELERLKHALKLLSEAEKQLRVSNERSTWFTATLLQLGSVCSSETTHSGSSRRQVSKTTDENPSSASREVIGQKQRAVNHYSPQKSTSPTALQGLIDHDERFLLTNGVSVNSKRSQSLFVNNDTAVVSSNDVMVSNTKHMIPRCVNSDKLDDIWVQCIEKCHSKTLRQLLLTHGKLISISEVEGLFIAYVAFEDKDVKIRAERFLSSITNSFETIIQFNVEVRIILLPDGIIPTKSGNKVVADSFRRERLETTKMVDRDRKAICLNSEDSYSDLDQDPLKVSKGSFGNSASKLGGTLGSVTGSPTPLVEGNGKVGNMKEKIPMQRIESIIREQRLETAWLQAVEKGTPGSLSRLKPEKNQILPQEGISSQPWQDELNHEMKLLKFDDGKEVQKDLIGRRIDQCPISPSLLHDRSGTSNFSKENMGYESGTGAGGCSGILCWNAAKPRKRAKVKQRTPVRSHKGVGFSWLGECAKAKKTENRSGR